MGVGSFMGELSWFARLQALQLPTRSVSWVAFRSRPLLCFEQLGYPHGLRRCWWADRCWRPTGSHDWKVGPILQRLQRLLAALDASVRAQHAYLVRFYLKCFFPQGTTLPDQVEQRNPWLQDFSRLARRRLAKWGHNHPLNGNLSSEFFSMFLVGRSGWSVMYWPICAKNDPVFFVSQFLIWRNGLKSGSLMMWSMLLQHRMPGSHSSLWQCPLVHFVALSFQSLCFTLLQAHPNEAEHECCFQAAFQGRGVASSTGCGWDCPLWLAALASIQEGGRNFSCNAPATLSDPSKNAYALPRIQIPGSSVAI